MGRLGEAGVDAESGRNSNVRAAGRHNGHMSDHAGPADVKDRTRDRGGGRTSMSSWDSCPGARKASGGCERKHRKLQMTIVWRYEVEDTDGITTGLEGHELQGSRRQLHESRTVHFEECCRGDRQDQSAPRADGTHPFLWHPFWEGRVVTKAVMVFWYHEVMRRIIRDHILSRQELFLIRKFRAHFLCQMELMRVRSREQQALGSDKDLVRLLSTLEDLEYVAWTHMAHDTASCDLCCFRCKTDMEFG
eukprot:TRINITY_DN13674_c0_g2_i1.p1 TRINITY_DN13674_c0_g2~~TRINITY_DN13674_c0_g2_i1.p1  ORF type:complete len:248 (+),score=32.27 TRINITY_DN13674_c0_g2_i1:139-882(+)